MAKNLKGITVDIGGNTTKLGKAIRDVDKDTRALQRELRGVNTLLKYDPKNIALTQQKQELLTKAVDGTREKLNTLKEAQAQVQEQFEKGEITEEQYRDFQREIAFTEQRLKDYERQLAEVSKEHRTLEQSLEITSDKMKDVGKKMSDVGGDMTKKLTLPLAAVGGVAAKLGIDFEKAMSEVQAVSGATAEEMEVLEKAAREAGATTDKSARDAADALQYMALAGWDVETSQQALMPMLKLSSAANMELGRTSDLVTDTMSVLGLEIDDLEGYLDVLAHTSRNSNTNVEQLGEAFLVVGGRLKMLNVDVEEGAAALGVLANNGIKGSEAGRGLNAVLTNLTAPTGRAKTALEELGVSAFDSNGEFIGIEETLKLVQDATKDMTQEQQNMYYSMIAGKEHAKTFNALMDGLGGGFDELSGHIAGADGALEEMYDTATDNTMGALNNLKSAMEELALKIWENLQPAFEAITKVLQKVVDWLNSLSPEMQQTIVTIGLIVAAIGPLLLIGGKIISGIGMVIGVLGKVIGVVKIVGGAVMALTGGALLPAIAIIAGVVAAIVAVIAIFKNWGAITDWVSEKFGIFINWIQEKFGWLPEWFHATFDPFIADAKMIIGLFSEAIKIIIDGLIEHVVTIFTFLKDTVMTIVGTLVDIVQTLFMGMVDHVVIVIQGFLEIMGNLFNILYTIIKAPVELIIAFATGGFKGLVDKSIEIFNNLKDSVGNIFNAIRTMLSNIVTNIKNVIVNIFKSMVNGAVNVFKGFLTSVRNIFTNIGNTIKRLMKIDLSQIGKDIMMGLVRGITNSIKAVTDAVKNVASSITGSFKKFFGIKSPSRVMRDVVGKMIPQGIAVGVEADADEALEAVDDLNKKLMVASEPDMLNMMSGNPLTNPTDSTLEATNSIGGKLDRMVNVFDTYLDKLSDPNYQVVLDNGVLVGELKNDFDKALGREQQMKGRGR